MSRHSRYRSWMMAVAVAGGIACGACGDLSNHETLKVQSLNKWNLTRVSVIYQVAEQQYKVGDYDKCDETLKEAFATKAIFAPMYILQAKVQIERGNLEPAAENLNIAIRLDAAGAEPYYLLGVLYQRWQKPDVACDYYRQAWTKKPDEVRYLLATVEMQISLGQLDEAQTTIENKLVYFEQSAALRVALARIAILKNDFTTASTYYREAVTLMPDDEPLQRSYAESLFFSGQFAKAAPLFEDMRKSSEVADRANLLMMLGQSYMGLHRSQDARNCFQEVIRDKPDDMLAYLNLGKACVETGDLGLALSAGRKVQRTEPENVEAMILVALVQQKQKKWADAQVTLEKASRINASDSTVLCMLGINARELGNKAQAVAFYEKAVQANPKDAWAVELLGQARPSASQATPENPPAVEVTPAPAAASVAPADNAAGSPTPPAVEITAAPKEP